MRFFFIILKESSIYTNLKVSFFFPRGIHDEATGGPQRFHPYLLSPLLRLRLLHHHWSFLRRTGSRNA
ncbi:hypothetical protein BRARA_E02586 [Brassica rapa]|uniref:Uncharacterized protein n=1 Tax=Brassica campestris TaxID=3711 RepID=A0A397ZDQ8_BRACM|nr:hypothetical protein BRARA_E02586 [Brassica rapa]